jgi:signal transduction histidine kinase
MRAHWWQSIRWRLALGSMLVALLATILLAGIILIIITVSYGGDQSQQLTNLAGFTASRIGKNFVHTNDLFVAAEEIVPGLSTQSNTGGEYLQLVYTTDHPPKLIYPRAINGKLLPSQLLVAATDPSVNAGDFRIIQQAINKARYGITTSGSIGSHSPGGSSRPFVVEPIFVGGYTTNTVVGILLVIPRSAVDNTTPPFLATVRLAIFVVALIVALLAALVAILFSRTITRPLAKLTSAARGMAGGNYTARVNTNARGELGELAGSFNEMATRLEQDVDELRQQELRRRELIMNITHDLATPLTAIAGLGEALADGISQNHDDFQETGRVIVRETLRLRRLVKDLHMMAKAEAGAMQPQRKAVRLAPLVDEVFATIIPEFERVDVEPRNNLSFNLPTVWADPDMLTRVFDNLCSNALRYTPAGGNVSIDAMQQGTLLRVAVTDSGKGIPTEALPRIFDRFYRADPARQVTTGGSGLGLAIVRAIVEAHGGSVQAENAPGAGARISFTLPLAAANWEQLASETTMPLSMQILNGRPVTSSGAEQTQPRPPIAPAPAQHSPAQKPAQPARTLPQQEPTQPMSKRPPNFMQ